MKIKDCIGICNAKLIVGTLEDELKNFSKDTRTIKEGDTYIALKGEVFNGNTFFEDAFRKGAKTCILDELDQPELIHEKATLLSAHDLHVLWRFGNTGNGKQLCPAFVCDVQHAVFHSAGSNRLIGIH